MPAKVLVVEDEQIVALDIQRTLQALGYLVPETVATGDAAIQKAEELLPDVVLMDIRLRGPMDGVVAASVIRERLDVPVIYLTAHADAATLARAKITEPFGYLLKPFEERDLHTTVEMALYKHQMERKLRQRAAELALNDRRKDEFLAMLGHELRNPLAGILNSVEVLKQLGSPQAEAAAVLAIIDRQATHMRRIVDDLLDVTRVAHGKITLRKAPLDVVELVRQAAEDQRPNLQSRQATLRLELPLTPIYCEVDPTRLSQALANLLVNAGKFLGGRGEVTVRVRDQAENGSVAIQVGDTGVGMDAQTLRDIFQPFVQASQRLDRGEGGLGLGLALVRGLVQLHGGRITASSQGVGQGAEFTIELPVCPPPAEAPAPPARRPSGVRRRVLVVDDHPDALFAIRRMLELGGHEVFTAADGASAIKLVHEKAPQVVFCDIGLPGMNGYEFAAAIRSDPSSAGIYLVALSGYGREEDRRRAADAGFDAHETKPVSRAQLERLVASAS